MRRQWLIFGAGIAAGVLVAVAPLAAAYTKTVEVNIPSTALLSDIVDDRNSVSVIENKDDRCYVVTNQYRSAEAISCVKIGQ